MSTTALVTGASSGIGQAIALRLASRGIHVFGTARRPAQAQSAPFEVLPLDVRSEESVEQSVQLALSRAGKLDLLVNNAGYALTRAAEETSLQEAKAQVDTNFFGAVRVANAGPPTMP